MSAVLYCQNKSSPIIWSAILFLLLGGAVWAGISSVAHAGGVDSSAAPQIAGENCLACHQGVEPIRASDSGMMVTIRALGTGVGDPDGCVVCHGGNPQAVTEEEAHTEAPQGIRADTFYPDPGSIWIVDKTCGQCHLNKTYNLMRALMQTEAGKIQGNTWAWGSLEGYGVEWGNYNLDDPDGSEPAEGTEAYKAYMEDLMAAYPDVFPHSLQELPNPSPEEVEQDPALAVFTYQRQECQRCHVGVKGRSERGDWRGMGCSSCHIPYSNEGFYEGDDPTVPKDEAGHLLVHSIQATRESQVDIGDKTYSGIPTETCNSCHNRGKRIGVTYQGLMEFPYGSPYNDEGEKQPKLHTKQYLFIKEDLHHEQQSRPENPEGSLLCQDCHTSIDIHGDGNIFGTTLAQVEIECADCHGTPDKYPWELPLGFQEEFGEDLSQQPPRGTADKLLPFQSMATVYDAEDGYLLTTRGNPFGNVVRQGDQVVVHSANGLDFQVPLLKKIKQEEAWRNLSAEVAMDKIAPHMGRMECYACHADWAPQCYGCHVSVDYSGGTENVDWVASGSQHNLDGTTAESPLDVGGLTSQGDVSESRSYLRWEEPILGINGEGRVTPLMPGCQVVSTVIGSDGQTLVSNQIWQTLPNTEGAGPEGQRGLDMAPVQPHSAGRQARTCESCHSNPKTLGYGIEDGRFQASYSLPIYEDLMDEAGGEILPGQSQPQIEAIPELPMDWSQIITRDGQQLQTVGSHWPLSRPLNDEERARMERTGVCMGCHQNMADPAFWDEQVIAEFGRALANEQHIDTMNKLIREAVATGESASSSSTVIYAVVALVVGLLAGGGIVFLVRRRGKAAPDAP